jgi:hypothetical protein
MAVPLKPTNISYETEIIINRITQSATSGGEGTMIDLSVILVIVLLVGLVGLAAMAYGINALLLVLAVVLGGAIVYIAISSFGDVF